MKCADILRALNDHAGDLKAVRCHIKGCPECSRRFSRDLEIEEALRNLDLEMAPVDITAEVEASLGLLRKRRSTRGFIHRWVWVTASVAIFALLMITMPILAGWLGKAWDLINRYDVGRLIDSVMPSAIPSVRPVHLLCLIVAVIAWMAVYLLRESKRTVR
jgi:hypothetical protein